MSFEILNHRSIKDIKKSLTRLDKLDLRKISSDHFLEECKTAFNGVVMPRLISFSPEVRESEEWGIFRARLCNSETPFENESDFWEPPREYAKHNRCNDAGEPMLYCANHIATALVETGVTVGSYWTVSDFYLPASKAIPGLALGHRDHSFLKQAKSSIEQFYEGISVEQQKKNDLIDDYIHRCFRGSINKNKNIYKKTIGITKYFMHPEGNTDIKALFYPSVASGLKGANIVFEPSVAKQSLLLRRTYFVKVTSINSKQNTIVLKTIAVGTPKEGKIVWDYGTPLQNQTFVPAVR